MAKRIRLFCDFCGIRIPSSRNRYARYRQGRRSFCCSSKCYSKLKVPEEFKNLKLFCSVCNSLVELTYLVKRDYKKGKRRFYCSHRCYSNSRKGVACPFVAERMKGNTYREGKPPGNKYHVVNEDFFKEIDSELSAYWFGMLMADGSMKYGKSGYSVGLGLIDEGHVKQFLKDIGLDAIIKVDHTNKKPWYYARVNGKQFCTYLYEKGMIPRKTQSLTFPACVPDELMNHFIRGYWDGDGHIGANLKNFDVGVVGTFSFISTLADVVKDKAGLSANGIHRHSNELYVFRKTKLQAKKVCDFLYKDATSNIWLDRKHDIFYNDWIDNKPRSNKCRPIICEKQDETVLFSAISDAEKGGYDKSCIFDCLAGRSKKYRGLVWRYATQEDISKYSALIT